MRLTCSNCNHSVDLKPESLNSDGSYYGRCSNCGQRLIKQPKRVEEQALKTINHQLIVMPTKEAGKTTLNQLITVLSIQTLIPSIFALLLAWNNSRNPVVFNFSLLLYMLWLVSACVGGALAVDISEIRHTALAGVLSVFGAILVCLFHWFMLCLLSGAGVDWPNFLAGRIRQGIIIETYRPIWKTGYLTVGGSALLLVWLLESIFICLAACLGAVRQAKKISSLPFDR